MNIISQLKTLSDNDLEQLCYEAFHLACERQIKLNYAYLQQPAGGQSDALQIIIPPEQLQLAVPGCPTGRWYDVISPVSDCIDEEMFCVWATDSTAKSEVFRNAKPLLQEVWSATATPDQIASDYFDHVMMRPQGCETLRAARAFKVEICVQSGRYAWVASFAQNKKDLERGAALVIAALGVASGRSFHPRSGSSDLVELVEAIRQWLQTTSPAPTRHETGGPALPVTSAGQSTTAVPYQPLQLHSAPHVSSAESQTEQESITAHASRMSRMHLCELELALSLIHISEPTRPY